MTTLPHTFTDGPGNVASGEAVTDNDQALLAGLNVLETLLSGKTLLGGFTKIKVGIATVAISGAGAGAAMNSAAITHALGATPVGAFGLCIPGGTLGASIPIECALTITSTTVVFQHRNNSGGVLGAGTVRIAYLVWA